MGFPWVPKSVSSNRPKTCMFRPPIVSYRIPTPGLVQTYSILIGTVETSEKMDKWKSGGVEVWSRCMPFTVYCRSALAGISSTALPFIVLTERLLVVEMTHRVQKQKLSISLMTLQCCDMAPPESK